MSAEVRKTDVSPLATTWMSTSNYSLGLNEKVDSLEIRWPSGLTERIENVRTDQILTLEEGRSPSIAKRFDVRIRSTP